MSNKLVVIDGNSIFYRSFYALPLLSNSRGEYSNAVYGFAIQILNIIQNIKPKYMVVAFDASKKTFRNELYSEYKATRKPMPDELRSQIEPLKKMLKLMDIQTAEKEGLEGDDIIGIISKKFLDTETIIVTGDRDSFQLVDDSTSVYFTKKGTSDVKIINPKELKNEYGVTPSQFIDLKALQGDTSDNIPGIAGVGPKTATDLITKYGDLDGVYAHIDEISGQVKEKLEAGKEMAYISKKLATIVTKGEMDLSLKDLEFEYPFSSAVFDFFKYYEFKTLVKNQNNFDMALGEKSEVVFDEINCDNNEKLQNIVIMVEKHNKFAVFFKNDAIHLSFGLGEIVVSTVNDLISKGINENAFFDEFKRFFESEKVFKICFDSKQDMYYLKKFGIELNNYFDCSVAKYLVDGVPVDNVKDVFFDDDIKFIASKMIDFEREYSKKIKDENLVFLYNSVELPLTKVLFSMENAGFRIDTEILMSLKQKYQHELDKLSSDIYKLAGEEFNINSPKQLAHILYEKLNLPHKKKQSTNAESLEEIKSEHDIVVLILRYRKVAKFLSTYIDGLYPHLDKDNFVHTYFKQTFTTTGRLSSIEPNLQNIPIRSEESREIRSMFVASSKDNILIDADYSQIELRLLAHLSGDKVFVDAFNHNEDIHTKTACTVFGVTEDMVTKEMRRMAKVVNFGIIYGISEYGLADDLKIAPRDARALIANFYQKHEDVKKFMDNAIAVAKETGKATTMFGRTRKMFDINASNFMVRSRAERASQNMPLQGTAADIIKIAMVNTFKTLKESNLKAKLIMQVHDELIVDAPLDEKDKVIEILRNEMENAAKLKVPLVAQIESSYRWSDGH